MTRDVRVGRVLVVALQQAIAEELPARVEFYDHWLGREGRRDGTLEMAQMIAVVGFLRTEGAGYERVVTRAGELVAAWTWSDTRGWTRRCLPRLPRWWRSRSICRQLTTVIARTYPGTVAKAAVSRGVVTLRVRESVFCITREAPASPLCAFYAALLVAMFASVNLVASGQMDQCCAGAGPAGKGCACLGTFAISSAP